MSSIFTVLIMLGLLGSAHAGEVDDRRAPAYQAPPRKIVPSNQVTFEMFTGIDSIHSSFTSESSEKYRRWVDSLVNVDRLNPTPEAAEKNAVALMSEQWGNIGSKLARALGEDELHALSEAKRQ